MGLDLSLTGTGVVVLKDDHVVLELLIKSKPTDKKRPVDEIERIVLIKEKIISIIKEFNPDMVVIEGMAFGVRNATALTQLSGLNYMIREYLWKNKIDFRIVAPTSLKKFITGNGKAKKEEMMISVFDKFHVSFVDDNIVDSFSLAVVGRTIIIDDPQSEGEKSLLTILKKQS